MTFMSDAGANSADNSLRIAILGDPDNYIKALDKVQKATLETGDKIKDSFSEVGSFLMKTIGYIGFATALEGAVESASTLVSYQKVQGQVLQNQLNPALLKQLQMQKQSYTNGVAISNVLTDYTTQQSISTGISRDQLTQTETLLLTNREITKEMTAQGANMVKNGSMFSLAVTDAENMSAVTHQGILSSAKMLNRVLNDPAKRISAMSRGAVQLSLAQQNYIKQIEAAQGKQAARMALLNTVNQQLQGAAESAMSPMERLQNDFQILYQQLGLIFLPLLDALATTLSSVLNPISQVLTYIGKAFSDVMEGIGQNLGQIFGLMTPWFKLLTQTIIPAIFTIIEPLVNLATNVLTPLSNDFQNIVNGSPGWLNLSTIIANIAKVMSGDLMTGVNQVAAMFNQMQQNGTLQQLFNSLAQSLEIMAPILPALVQAFVDMAVALLPIGVKALPYVADLLKIFADMATFIAKLIPPVANFVSKLMKIGAVKDLLIVLATFWFTKRLFMTPMMSVLGGLGKIGSRIGGLIGTMKQYGSTVKDFGTISKTAEGAEMSRAARMKKALEDEARTGKAWRLNRIEELKAKGPKGVEKAEKLEKDLSKAERRFAKYERRYNEAERKGGGIRGLLKSVFSIGMGNLPGEEEPKPKDQFQATIDNTNALIQLTNQLASGGGLFGNSGGGGGNNLEQKLENKLKSKLEGKVKSELEGKVKSELEDKLEGKLEGKLAGKLEGNVGKRLAGRLLERYGGRAGQMISKFAGLGEEGAGLAEGAGETALVGGGEAAAEGGILAAGAASGAATLGIGLAVAGATVAYMKYHKAINKWIKGTAKHLYHAAQDVVKWGQKEGQHLVNGVKDVAKFAGRVGHAAMGVVTGGIHAAGTILHGVGSAIGGFFGGLFGGGGGGGKSSGGGGGGQTYWLIRIAHHTYDSANYLRYMSGNHAITNLMRHPIMKKMESERKNYDGRYWFIKIAGNTKDTKEALRAMNRSGHQGAITIEKGAFVITVNGAVHPDEHAKVVQKVVNDNMKELQRVLRTLGRGI
jgi:hypothetical protein